MRNYQIKIEGDELVLSYTNGDFFFEIVLPPEYKKEIDFCEKRWEYYKRQEKMILQGNN